MEAKASGTLPNLEKFGGHHSYMFLLGGGGHPGMPMKNSKMGGVEDVPFQNYDDRTDAYEWKLSVFN